MVCDKIRSKVQIFYKSHQGTVSAEDKEDMYNLLVETIYGQASEGSFGSIGDVSSVEVEDESSNSGGTSDRGGLADVPDPSGGERTFEGNKGPILGAAAGFVALFGAGYWYAMGSDEEPEEKNEQTDESDSD